MKVDIPSIRKFLNSQKFHILLLGRESWPVTQAKSSPWLENLEMARLALQAQRAPHRSPGPPQELRRNANFDCASVLSPGGSSESSRFPSQVTVTGRNLLTRSHHHDFETPGRREPIAKREEKTWSDKAGEIQPAQGYGNAHLAEQWLCCLEGTPVVPTGNKRRVGPRHSAERGSVTRRRTVPRSFSPWALGLPATPQHAAALPQPCASDPCSRNIFAEAADGASAGGV
jgi:hypothetical protein